MVILQGRVKSLELVNGVDWMVKMDYGMDQQPKILKTKSISTGVAISATQTQQTRPTGVAKWVAIMARFVKNAIKWPHVANNDIEVHSPDKIIDRRPSIDQCEAESEADMLPALQKKGSAKKIDKKKIPATQNTPTTKAQPFKKKKTIDLASPSGKDTSANLAPLPDESTSPDNSTSPDKPVPHESGDSKGSRSKNYDDEEDVCIFKSWLHVSQDPLNSTNQAGDTFWKRQKKGSAKKIDKKKIPATQNTPTTKAQPFKKKKTIDLASPSGKDTSANLAPLPDESTSPDNSTSPDKPVPHESGDSKGSRSKNYDDEEDVCIFKSWLHVSQDPLNSTNQAGDTFWKRVGNITKDLDKRQESLAKLQHAVNKFCGAIEQVKLSNQSGVNAEDQFNNGLKYYKATSEKNKKFSHLQCYYVLHEAPKWKEHRVEWLKKQQDKKKNGEKSGSTINSSIMDSGTIESLASDPNKDDTSSETSSFKKNATGCPSIGTRKAKDLVAKAREDKKFKKDIISVHRDLAQQTKKQNKILSVQQEALTTLANHAIMLADLVTASKHSRRFYEWSQMKVLEKIEKERAEYEKKKKKPTRSISKKNNRNTTKMEEKNPGGRKQPITWRVMKKKKKERKEKKEKRKRKRRRNA
ncbi:hypothetical protein PSTT_13213 [Puccinia striiformis]|uniref:No apical meristem-associated C-terminal domain-containing protein n=1 Tax=Puccinia striiformis TaxID=27350 RepID=A0A2S4USP7_9BASI|nr:hypothetical protein PSTT_13213 [Puccinia striiformis]